MVSVESFRPHLESDLKKQLIPSTVLLDTLRLINDGDRKSSAYVDPNYMPFYYHLGKYITPQNMVEFGVGIGFSSACFLKSCKSVKSFLGFQELGSQFYSKRLAARNLKSVYREEMDLYAGRYKDQDLVDKIQSRKWDLVICNEELSYDKHIYILDRIWEQMNLDGYLIMDYVNAHEPAKEAFANFCKIKNRERIVFPTRYGVGIVQR